MSLEVRLDHLKIIQDILSQYVPNRSVWAFGSRIKGTAKKTSDLDLCIMGSEKLSFEMLSKLRDAFSLSIIPYKVDVVDWHNLTETFQQIIAEQYVIIQTG